jgi:plasmid stabilization system protein ParE
VSSKYDIRYLRTAECDLYGIFDYIGQDNPSAATALLEKIDQSIALLASNPYLGVIPKEKWPVRWNVGMFP